MPRVANTGPNVMEWYEEIQEGSSTHDVCYGCYHKLVSDPNRYNHKLQPYQYKEPQGTDGWVGEVYHPPYEDEDYRCEVCNKKLTAKDNDYELG